MRFLAKPTRFEVESRCTGFEATCELLLKWVVWTTGVPHSAQPNMPTGDSAGREGGGYTPKGIRNIRGRRRRVEGMRA